MSPIAVGGSASGDFKKESTLARLLGSGMVQLKTDRNWLYAKTRQDLPVSLSLLCSIQYEKNQLLTIRASLIH